MKLNIVNTNKIINILALMAILSGFNNKDADPQASFIQVASGSSRFLYKYVNEFVEEAQKRGIEVDKADLASIDFVYGIYLDPKEVKEAKDSNTKTIGFCHSYYGVKRIEISHFESAIDIYYVLRNIMFHELGHCLLNLEHSENPEDIMYYEVNNHSLNHWNESLDRLFASYKPEEGLREIFH